MASKNMFLMRVLLQCILVVVVFTFLATCDVEKDKEKCANDLVGLATCLPYVSGEAKSPPIDCCTGLKQVLQKSPECICLLVKDRNDPSLGLKINATLALSLPSQCHSPANVTDCPALLHLPPNSPDAKVFDDFANNGKGSANTSTAPAAGGSSSARTTATTTKTDESDGGNKKRILGTKMVLGLFVTMIVVHNFPNL